MEKKGSKKVWRQNSVKLEKYIWLAIHMREQICHGASEQATGALLSSYKQSIVSVAYRAEGVKDGHYSGKEEQNCRSFRRMERIGN